MNSIADLDLAGSLLLVGAGKMGGAMLAGWLENGLDPTDVAVLDPGPPPEMAAILGKFGIATSPDIAALNITPAIIIMAVKPQMMDDVFPAVAELAGPDTLTISIAAGRTIASFEKHLAPASPVVRTIPNTPAAIGRGITVCCANTHVTDAQRAMSTVLLQAVGEVDWVDDEALIDAVTGVSGSGPAYVFALTECLARAGVAAGLDAELAMRLARATVSGAGELMHRSDESASNLRKNVTSPGGTTAAALEILMPELTKTGEAGGLCDLMTKAVAAATARGRALSS